MTQLSRFAAKTFAALFFLLPVTRFANAQSEAALKPPQISFEFERQGLPVPKFTLSVDESGNAHYVADEVIPNRISGQSDTPQMQHIDRTVTLSKSATGRIFATAEELHHFDIPCASKLKNIADTGTKTLRYAGQDAGHENASCTYNYSENKRVTQLTDLFQGIARTLDVGRRLDFQHRFDRLGLDATMASLVEEVDSGRATEVAVIAPTLRSLVEDPAVLQRVRERAARLLQNAQPTS